MLTYEPKWPIRPELISFSVALSDWEYCYSPLDGMLVHRRVTPVLNLPVPVYTPGWREALWDSSVLPKNTTQGPEPGPLDPESSSLTTRPPRLYFQMQCHLFFTLKCIYKYIFFIENHTTQVSVDYSKSVSPLSRLWDVSLSGREDNYYATKIWNDGWTADRVSF